MIDLVAIAANATLTELYDTKQATVKYLFDFGTEHSWKYCPDEIKTTTLEKEQLMIRLH